MTHTYLLSLKYVQWHNSTWLEMIMNQPWNYFNSIPLFTQKSEKNYKNHFSDDIRPLSIHKNC